MGGRTQSAQHLQPCPSVLLWKNGECNDYLIRNASRQLGSLFTLTLCSQSDRQTSAASVAAKEMGYGAVYGWRRQALLAQRDVGQMEGMVMVV